MSRHRLADIFMTATLTVAMASGTVIAFVPGTLAPFIVGELRLTTVHVGMLAAAPSAVGALMSSAAGRWVDVAGGRRALGVLFLITGFALAVFSGAPSFVVMLSACALGGLGTAISNPATNRLMLDRVSADRRYIAFGVKQSGVQIGAAVVGLTMPGVAIFLGWRAAIALLALIVGSCTVVAACMSREPRLEVPSTNASKPYSGSASSVTRIRSYALLSGFGVGAASVHLPLFAYREVVANAAVAGMFAGSLGLAGIVSRVFWGALGNRIRDVPRVVGIMAITSFAATLLVLFAAAANNVPLMWIASVLLGFGGGWNVLGVLHVIRGTPHSSAGAVSGRIQAAYLTGLVVGPLGFGVLSSLGTGYTGSWLSSSACFVGAALVAMFWRRDERRL